MPNLQAIYLLKGEERTHFGKIFDNSVHFYTENLKPKFKRQRLRILARFASYSLYFSSSLGKPRGNHHIKEVGMVSAGSHRGRSSKTIFVSRNKGNEPKF